MHRGYAGSKQVHLTWSNDPHIYRFPIPSLLGTVASVGCRLNDIETWLFAHCRIMRRTTPHATHRKATAVTADAIRNSKGNWLQKMVFKRARCIHMSAHGTACIPSVYMVAYGIKEIDLPTPALQDGNPTSSVQSITHRVYHSLCR
jgi:hypothetical protein